MKPGSQPRRPSKVRTGCLTCKDAKVKCPEQKPTCHRCVRLGLTCEYRSICERLRGTTASARLILPASSRSMTGPATAGRPGEVLLLARPRYSWLSPEGSIYFDYFRDELIDQLRDQVSPEFWSRTVMRECMTDDCIRYCTIAIAALARAKTSSPTDVPLFGSQLDGLGQSRKPTSHYQTAVEYYGAALSLQRRRISSVRTQSRAILIVTILFATFEMLQGNTVAVDKLTANCAQVLHGQLLQQNTLRTRVAGAHDDEGVHTAGLSLMRMTAVFSMTSPMFRVGRENAHLICQPLHCSIVVPKADATLAELTDFWSHQATTTALWRFQVNGEAALWRSDPNGEARIRGVQTALLAQIQRGLDVTQQKLSRERDPMRQALLQFGLLGSKLVYITVECYDDKTGAGWDRHVGTCREIAGFATKFVKGILSPQLHLMYDGALATMMQIVRDCRDLQARSQALDICKLLVSAQSGWDIKSFFMGISALVDLEEDQRVDGVIPLGARYDWTYGQWSDDYSKLHVGYERVLGADAHPGALRMALRLEDYGLV